MFRRLPESERLSRVGGGTAKTKQPASKPKPRSSVGGLASTARGTAGRRSTTSTSVPASATRALSTSTRRSSLPSLVVGRANEARTESGSRFVDGSRVQTKTSRSRKTTTKSSLPSSSAVSAAALQDHFARTLKLPSSAPKPRKSTTTGSILPSFKPSLAQSLGLVKPPPHKLTDPEWEAVATASRSREDSVVPCSICLEPYTPTGPSQVLLSCSHTFHAPCLAAFESHTGATSCPLCRAEHYQKRRIRDGANATANAAATKISAWWRGVRTRTLMRPYLDRVVPEDPARKVVWAAKRLESTSSNLEAWIESKTESLDAFLESLDQSLAASRAVFGSATSEQPVVEPWTGEDHVLDEVEMDLARRRAQVATAVSRLAPTPGVWDSTRRGGTDSGSSGKGVRDEAKAVDWGEMASKVHARGLDECPICMGDLEEDGDRVVSVLSCSHTFHETCVASFEVYALDESAPTCAVCRQTYERRRLSDCVVTA